MNERLDEALRKLAAENAKVEAPPEIRARVMAEFNRPRRSRVRWGMAAIAAACIVVLAIAALLLRRPAPPAVRAEKPFIAIPYVAPPAPYERTEIRRMNVPLAALLAAGIQLRTSSHGSTVPADVLVGQDGRPLAIRLVENAI